MGTQTIVLKLVLVTGGTETYNFQRTSEEEANRFIHSMNEHINSVLDPSRGEVLYITGADGQPDMFYNPRWIVSASCELVKPGQKPQ